MATNYDSKVDYQALINQAAANGNYAQAAIYEQQRNQKLADMNNAGTNKNNYQMTNNYSGYLNGGSGGSITPAQQMAQALSPATADQRQTVLSNMAGSMASGSAPAYQAPDTSAYDAQLASALNTLNNTPYVAPSWEDYYKERALDDYVAEAIRMMEPQYADKYDAARNAAATNLDRAGLYNSLYGQALAAQQENAVTRAMLSDASQYAQQQRQQDYDNAMALYKAAIDNAQFGYSSQGDRLKTTISSLHNSINEVMDRAKQVNDYNLEASAQAIQRQVAAADMLYQSAQIDSMEYENLLRQAQARTEAVDAQLKQAQLNELAGIQTGGIYQADANGKAPKGLSAGDYVKTNGGWYQITGVAADGSYTSKKVNDPTAVAAVDTGYSGGYSGGGGGYSYDRTVEPIVDNNNNNNSGGGGNGDLAYYGNLSQAVRRMVAADNEQGAAQAAQSAKNSGKITDAQFKQLQTIIAQKF